ncbi:hypothetical protein [Aureispira anguillae]|uniref:Uncharacterized protein n=1 Tax=Aureispira anguillae TaxID=2864201 RepID=A0A915YGY5_9BACT|nr:hypothetical protein [Aureispira anguillae]BDS12977.1 hypothetical protein AsAng_0037050 [Aureispira anguillae]
MKNDKNTSDPALEISSTPEAFFSKDFLSQATEIHNDKLEFLALFADMQRIFLCDIAKHHNYPDIYLNQLENNISKLQQMIVLA